MTAGASRRIVSYASSTRRMPRLGFEGATMDRSRLFDDLTQPLDLRGK
jgi:hypothetical protein